VHTDRWSLPNSPAWYIASTWVEALEVQSECMDRRGMPGACTAAADAARMREKEAAENGVDA